MAYLNANIPVEYAQIRREYLYDLKKHKGEVEDCIIFGVTAITGKALLFHAIMRTVLSFIVSPYRLLFNVVFNRKLFHPRDLMNFNCGIVFLITLLLLLGIFQNHNPVNTQEKTRNGTTVDIYLLLTLHIQTLIYQTLIIQRSRTNTSVPMCQR